LRRKEVGDNCVSFAYITDPFFEGSFTSGVHGHLTGVFNNCVICHDDAISIVIRNFPIPTTQQCRGIDIEQSIY